MGQKWCAQRRLRSRQTVFPHPVAVQTLVLRVGRCPVRPAADVEGAVPAAKHRPTTGDGAMAGGRTAVYNAGQVLVFRGHAKTLTAPLPNLGETLTWTFSGSASVGVWTGLEPNHPVKITAGVSCRPGAT